MFVHLLQYQIQIQNRWLPQNLCHCHWTLGNFHLIDGNCLHIGRKIIMRTIWINIQFGENETYTVLTKGPFRAHGVRNFCTLKIKFDLTLCQSLLHTAFETFVRHKKKFGSGSIFCIFASVESILIGKFRTRCARTFVSVCKRDWQREVVFIF